MFFVDFCLLCRKFPPIDPLFYQVQPIHSTFGASSLAIWTVQNPFEWGTLDPILDFPFSGVSIEQIYDEDVRCILYMFYRALNMCLPTEYALGAVIYVVIVISRLSLSQVTLHYFFFF